MPLCISNLKLLIDNQLFDNNAYLDSNDSKIIELSVIELRKLRVNLQKTQLQNWNLAQANSQMIAVGSFPPMSNN